ncbi:hypothetical protein BDY21DRAFT_345881 [Lineolata rhizophorae]|uniref:Secreted protein n=1 Tax=Lineolata rhizophorae TaxID=578093 RepID=A0A6A6NZS2_9PEZI|nr:hypothetical protein BDY21DRAFT_345881 [Lineolata rhizophorae]
MMRGVAKILCSRVCAVALAFAYDRSMQGPLTASISRRRSPSTLAIQSTCKPRKWLTRRIGPSVAGVAGAA